ncbi:MAG: ornithine carbamoyltransferase [Actinomycetes bacterium]
MTRHFLTGEELDREQLLALLARAHELKAAPASSDLLTGKSVALIFEKPSTRTRLSYEVGVTELGGHAVVLRPGEMQLSRGESIADTARVLSGQVAAVGVRTGPDAVIEELAAEGSIPVFNMLTELHHPSQVLADLMTLQEAFPGRPLDELKLAYVGDGNNVARSLAILGTTAGVNVVVASPAGYELEPDCGGERSNDPRAAVDGADALYTDVWVSMGDEESAEQRRAALEPFRLDEELLALAAEGAIALHCLPAHPDEEITAELLYGQRQRIWDQAENRRHAQKAMLEWLLADR